MSRSAPRVDTLRRMPARAADRGPLRVPGGRPPQPRAASAGSGFASRRSLRACSSAGVRIARRIPMGRGSERCIGMRTAGPGLVRGCAVGADGIPIRCERRSGAVRECVSDCRLGGNPPARRAADPEALRMGKPADWLLLSAATRVAASHSPFSFARSSGELRRSTAGGRLERTAPVATQRGSGRMHVPAIALDLLAGGLAGGGLQNLFDAT